MAFRAHRRARSSRRQLCIGSRSWSRCSSRPLRRRPFLRSHMCRRCQCQLQQPLCRHPQADQQHGCRCSIRFCCRRRRCRHRLVGHFSHGRWRHSRRCRPHRRLPCRGATTEQTPFSFPCRGATTEQTPLSCVDVPLHTTCSLRDGFSVSQEQLTYHEYVI